MRAKKIGLLLLWTMGVSLAQAQFPDAAPVTHPAGVPVQAIVLAAPTRVVTLDGRSQFWIDATGKSSVEQVEAAGDTLPWELRQRNARYRINDKALWIRFDAVVPDDNRWYLELRSSSIDRVQLFYRHPDGRWLTQEAGQTRPVSSWPLPGRLPTFELAPGSRQPIRYYLRAEQSRFDFSSSLVLHNQAALLTSQLSEQFMLGAFFGLAALIGFLAFANAVVHRDRSFAVYTVYVVTLAFGQLAYLGLGAQHVWTDWLRWNQIATLVLAGATTAAALWFVRTITEPARFSRVLDFSVLALIAAVLGAVAVDLLVASQRSLAVLLIFTAVGLMAALLLVMVVWSVGDDPYVRLIALGFLPVVVMAMFPVARGLNLMAASGLTRYGLSVGAAVQILILFYVLSVRGSRRREADVRSAALSRTDALTGLAHHRSLQQRLETTLTRCLKQKHACAVLAIRLANYDALVSEYGRDVAEKALVVTASLLRSTITDIDLAARVGNQEFTLLLEGPTTPEAATSCAQKVIARGLQQSAALPATASLKFNVAVAMLPDKGFDADGCIAWLRDAVNAIRPDARRAIRLVNF